MADAEKKAVASARLPPKPSGRARSARGNRPPSRNKAKSVAARAAATGSEKPPKTKRPVRRNYKLPIGVLRYSKTQMLHKRAKYRYMGKSMAERRKTETKPKKKPAPARYITKTIGGEKNGGTRRIRVRKLPRYYPTETRPRKPTTKKQFFCEHKRKLRKSITPGTILILVAGRHRGKRVVFLKQLRSGLLLITGPHALNGVPMRRTNQIYVIATKTKLDISKVKVPKGVSDGYFRRNFKSKKGKKKTEAGEIFESKKEKRVISERRKNDQIDIDKQVLNVISENKQKKTLLRYLVRSFSLSNKMYPHKMVF